MFLQSEDEGGSKYEEGIDNNASIVEFISFPYMCICFFIHCCIESWHSLGVAMSTYLQVVVYHLFIDIKSYMVTLQFNFFILSIYMVFSLHGVKLIECFILNET
jgi:hypothetical protein